jgi:hypothetical protein BACCOPRO_03208
MKPIIKTALGLLVLVGMSSCKSQKDYLYLADMTDEQGYAITQRYQPRIQRDDKLEITVSCKNPELAVPFNVTPGTFKTTETGKVVGSVNEQYYRVDNDGEINFPVLGKLYVAGLTLTQATEMIRQLIIEGNYIKDPIVTMEFKNFHYTVLGAAGRNGTYTCDGDRVTLLEAIAQAGDLACNADLGKIAVIREEGSIRKVHTVDIRNSDIFNSPAYYLAQNDIVYVRPKKPKSEEKTHFLQWLTVALSVVTATTSVIWVTK